MDIIEGMEDDIFFFIFLYSWTFLFWQRDLSTIMALGGPEMFSIS